MAGSPRWHRTSPNGLCPVSRQATPDAAAVKLEACQLIMFGAW
jgi:hypothetical protein